MRGGNTNRAAGDVDYNNNQNTDINNNIDRNKERTRPAGDQGRWQHNAEHRKGVSYSDQEPPKVQPRKHQRCDQVARTFRGRAEPGGLGDRGGVGDRAEREIVVARERAGESSGDRGSRCRAIRRQPRCCASQLGGGGNRGGGSNRGGAFQGIGAWWKCRAQCKSTGQRESVGAAVAVDPEVVVEVAVAGGGRGGGGRMDGHGQEEAICEQWSDGSSKFQHSTIPDP